jgi:hypothetical protein
LRAAIEGLVIEASVWAGRRVANVIAR